MAEGPSDIEKMRWITLRNALGIEIKTGMKRSSKGRPTLVLVNEILGQNFRLKQTAYKALNEKIVKEIGPPFNKPLP